MPALGILADKCLSKAAKELVSSDVHNCSPQVLQKLRVSHPRMEEPLTIGANSPVQCACFVYAHRTHGGIHPRAVMVSSVRC